MKALLPTGNLNDMVRLADVAEPEAAHDEAVIAVHAFSINRGETFLLEAPKPGWRPGKDVVGRVVHAAADGSGPARGARVVGHPPARGWAERVAVPVRQLAPLPDRIDTAVAAALPLAGLTALRLLRIVGAVAGRRLLLTGASGGVGHLFVELAASAGAEVTVVVGTPERGRRLLALGAHNAVVDVTDAPATMDVVLESVGGASLNAALTRLVPRGLLVWFGQAGRVPATLDFFSFFAHQTSATIRHFDYTDSDVPDAADLATLVRLIDTDRLHPEIGSVSPWEEASARLTDLRARRIRGKAVLHL
jgi:NADPH:quinone reductase-like Zn-dependent oxidoreductase